MTKPLYWTSLATYCDICNTEFDRLMYDANIFGGWGLVCHNCFERGHGKLGIGRGQKYEKQANGKWLCTGGRKE